MNNPYVEKFRASYVSMITALALVLILSPFIIFIPWPFFKNEDIAIIAGLALAPLIAILTAIRYLLLRVEIGSWFIIKKGIMGTQRIDLDPSCRFRYNIVSFSNVFGSDSSNNYTIIIKNKTSTIRLTSSVKGISRIAKFCREYEVGFIYPEANKQIRQGLWIDSRAIRQNSECVLVGRRKLNKPLKISPEVVDGILVLSQSKSIFGKIKIPLKTIWNPYSTVALLNDSFPTDELSMEKQQFLCL
ncbi:MAG: hypothetical protein LBV12_03095 [Puniceicoccales bacterium]|jgi:hypothetical protein|nr:hypothetical protein [Puniceicoccales bacterium]